MMNGRALWQLIGLYLVAYILSLTLFGLKLTEDVTAGDLLTVLLGILIASTVAFYWTRLSYRPFKMSFHFKPWDTEEDENPDLHSIIIQCNEDEPKQVIVALKLRLQRSFKTIDCRFVESKWFFFSKDAPKHQVKVVEIKDPQFQFSKHENNKKGGVEATYSELIDCPKGDVMWFYVTVKSDRNWNGYLSFQLRRGSSHRGLARLPLCFEIQRK